MPVSPLCTSRYKNKTCISVLWLLCISLQYVGIMVTVLLTLTAGAWIRSPHKRLYQSYKCISYSVLYMYFQIRLTEVDPNRACDALIWRRYSYIFKRHSYKTTNRLWFVCFNMVFCFSDSLITRLRMIGSWFLNSSSSQRLNF